MLAFSLKRVSSSSPCHHVKLQGDYDIILQQTTRAENEEYQNRL